MVEITDFNSLYQWLDTRPVEDQRIIATRAALRGLPGLASLFLAEDIDDPFAIILPVFRASAVSSTVGEWPVQQQRLKQAANSAAASAGRSARSASSANSANSAALSAALSADISAAADSAANSASSAGRSAADSALYSTLSAGRSAAIYSADSAARSAASAAWKAVEQDANRLEQGMAHGDLADQLLWPEGPPQGLAQAWPTLREALLSEDPLWHVWTDWYQDRLDGKPMFEALEVEKALIPDQDWEQGPAHVNAIIAEMIARHARSATPQGETLGVDPDSQRIIVERQSVKPRSSLENICDKIRDRLQDIQPRLEENQLTAFKPVHATLDRSVTNYTDRPRRLHDDFARAVVNTQTLLESGELAPDIDIQNLQADLQDSVDDLRAAYPEVDEMARARAAARIERLSPQDRAELGKAASAAEGITEPNLAEEIADDQKTLTEAPDTPTGPDGITDGPEKEAGYRLGGRLLRIWRLATNKEALKKTLKGAKEAADTIVAFTAAGGIIGTGIFMIFRLLGF